MTAEELAIWRALVDTTTELRRILGTRLLQESSLSPADYQVLLALSEADGRRLRSSELAATIDWERSRLSHHLGRMERRGLIRRDDCATDSRGAEVSLTDDGARMGSRCRQGRRHRGAGDPAPQVRGLRRCLGGRQARR